MHRIAHSLYQGERLMRQPTTTPLQLVVAALPDAALRPLLLELLGATPAAPSVSAPTDVAATTTPAPRAKHPGGRPRGSLNKGVMPPGRERVVRAVASGAMTQAAAARELGCMPKTIATWVKRHRGEP